LTKGKNSIDLKSKSDKRVDVLELLREWLDKNLEYGRIKPEIFVRNHVAYRFTLRRGDEEVSYEIQNTV